MGKAIRNPPRDAMLSHAAREMGYGWGFGVHEALDQFGAMFGPLLVALILATSHHDYKTAFAALAVPAAITLSLLAVARCSIRGRRTSRPRPAHVSAEGLPRVFWIYLAGAALVAAGFADFPIIAYHFQRSGTVRADLTPMFYAAAMAVSGIGSLVFGRLFDRHGIAMLVPLTLVSAAYAPLAFLGGFWASLVGVCLWGLGMGVHESIIPAAVAPMVSPTRRASAYGLFTGAYGIAWFLGSTAIGALFGVSLGVVVAFAVLAELAAIPLILIVRRRTIGIRRQRSSGNQRRRRPFMSQEAGRTCPRSARTASTSRHSRRRSLDDSGYRDPGLLRPPQDRDGAVPAAKLDLSRADRCRLFVRRVTRTSDTP